MGHVNSGARLDIRHRSGKSNQVPDALSRNPIAVSQILLFHSATASGSSPDNTTTATSETLSLQYWWKGMRADVCHFCRNCLVFASRKGTGSKTRPPLKSIPVSGPFEMTAALTLW